MHGRFSKSSAQRRLIGLLLLALAFRALIPAGFMPSAERPFTLQICPEGFPAHLLSSAHHHGAGQEHASHTSQPEHCVFAAGAAAGPAPAMVAWNSAAIAAPLAAPLDIEEFFAPSIVRSQSPRAPPVSHTV